MLRTLNPSQAIAVEIIGRGGTITEAARASEMHRVTVSKWANHHPEFKAEVNRIRADACQETSQSYRDLTLAAVSLIAEHVSNGDVESAFKWMKIHPPNLLTEQYVGPRQAEDVIEMTRKSLPSELEVMNDRMSGISTQDAETHLIKRLMLEGP